MTDTHHPTAADEKAQEGMRVGPVDRLAEIISDAEIERVHGHANFGKMPPREVVNDGVRKTAVGYHCGRTQFSILRDHGLITKPRSGSYDVGLTKKGKEYGRALFFAQAAPAPASESENSRLRAVISKIATLHGSLIRPEASVEFMELLPAEVEASIAHLQAAAAAGGVEPQNVGAIVPAHCPGMSLSFEPGVLHVSKDGSGYIAIGEDDFTLEDDRGEGPDGPEGSVHWITRLDASEMVALRDFLNGAALSLPNSLGEPFMYAYECVDSGQWQAFRHQLKRADGSICPGKPLYALSASAKGGGDE